MTTDERIRCCMRCGSRDIRYSSMGQGFHQPDGAAPPQSSCNECGFIGNPVIFESAEDYERFLKLKRRQGETEE